VDTPFITNQEIARVLFQIGALLETMEGNPFRVRAYRRAALGVLFLPRPWWITWPRTRTCRCPVSAVDFGSGSMTW
jgi:hypothetical protein